MIFLDDIQIGMIVLLISFFASLIFTLFIRKILKAASISDNPIVTEHRHKAGTPTMGGLAILMGVIFMACIYYDNYFLSITALIMIAAGVVGLLDDLLGLKIKEFQKIVKNTYNQTVKIGQLSLKVGEEARVATDKAKKDLKSLLEDNKVKIIGETPIKSEVKEREKILAQFIIALFLVITGAVTTIGGFKWGILAIPVIIIGIIGAINAVNLIDGMDGLAAGIMSIASLFCALYLNFNGSLNSSLPFLVLSGLSLGFLVFNRYPASIFMGDTGSFALGAGYATAVLLTDTVYFGVIALSIPIISVIISLMHRSHIIKLPVEPLHHTLHHKGLPEKSIVLLYWVLTLLTCFLALLFSTPLLKLY